MRNYFTEEKRQFKNLVDFIFSEDKIDKYLEDRTCPDDSKKNLGEVKSEYYYEVGDTQHRLHVHGITKLRHTGNYRLSNEKIRGVVEKILGKKVHFNASGSGDPEAACVCPRRACRRRSISQSSCIVTAT
jgi:hypothetical protein